MRLEFEASEHLQLVVDLTCQRTKISVTIGFCHRALRQREVSPARLRPQHRAAEPRLREDTQGSRCNNSRDSGSCGSYRRRRHTERAVTDALVLRIPGAVIL